MLNYKLWSTLKLRSEGGHLDDAGGCGARGLDARGDLGCPPLRRGVVVAALSVRSEGGGRGEADDRCGDLPALTVDPAAVLCSEVEVGATARVNALYVEGTQLL